ncbi:MAG: single-stranded DNA-binding protein [Mycoplasmataceae bacterium]|nr:single-stranded DNA-binding protein [Mycoplasmataceae bacterium]
MNKVFLVGRLVADPESYTTKTGNAQARITIATQDNRVKTESYFFPCIAWQNTANFINTYLHKGDLVAVDGKLTRRSFTNREGKTSYVTEIVIDQINSIGGKKEGTGFIVSDPTKKSTHTKSIDSAFPEDVVKQSSGNETHKPEPIKHDDNAPIEWWDETKEGK